MLKKQQKFKKQEGVVDFMNKDEKKIRGHGFEYL